MSREELKQAIAENRAKIKHLAAAIEAETDQRERKKLERRKKELQILQLWLMDQYEGG